MIETVMRYLFGGPRSARYTESSEQTYLRCPLGRGTRLSTYVILPKRPSVVILTRSVQDRHRVSAARRDSWNRPLQHGTGNSN